jgi:hypothetical protein
MVSAYGKGFVAALKAYIKTLPIEVQKQIKITLNADFDPPRPEILKLTLILKQHSISTRITRTFSGWAGWRMKMKMG